MKKAIVVFACLSLFVISEKTALSEKTESTKTLPPTVAQTYGPADTIIMWHDTNADGNPDYKATYVFKDGRLHQIAKSYPSDESFGFVKYINPR